MTAKACEAWCSRDACVYWPDRHWIVCCIVCVRPIRPQPGLGLDFTHLVQALLKASSPEGTAVHCDLRHLSLHVELRVTASCHKPTASNTAALSPHSADAANSTTKLDDSSETQL